MIEGMDQNIATMDAGWVEFDQAGVSRFEQQVATKPALYAARHRTRETETQPAGAWKEGLAPMPGDH